jgi:hypothetical protein
MEQRIRKTARADHGKGEWVVYDYGVALQPTPTWKAKLNDEQREIFEFYGYKFWP